MAAEDSGGTNIADLVRRTRVAQGLRATTDDPSALTRIAALVLTPSVNNGQRRRRPAVGNVQKGDTPQ